MHVELEQNHSYLSRKSVWIKISCPDPGYLNGNGPIDLSYFIFTPPLQSPYLIFSNHGLCRHTVHMPTCPVHQIISSPAFSSAEAPTGTFECQYLLVQCTLMSIADGRVTRIEFVCSRRNFTSDRIFNKTLFFGVNARILLS